MAKWYSYTVYHPIAIIPIYLYLKLINQEHYLLILLYVYLEYNYVIRRVRVRVDILRYDGKFVEYQYVSKQALVKDIRKLNKKKFEFTSDEVAMQLEVYLVDK